MKEKNVSIIYYWKYLKRLKNLHLFTTKMSQFSKFKESPKHVLFSYEIPN